MALRATYFLSVIYGDPVLWSQSEKEAQLPVRFPGRIVLLVVSVECWRHGLRGRGGGGGGRHGGGSGPGSGIQTMFNSTQVDKVR